MPRRLWALTRLRDLRSNASASLSSPCLNRHLPRAPPAPDWKRTEVILIDSSSVLEKLAAASSSGPTVLLSTPKPLWPQH